MAAHSLGSQGPMGALVQGPGKEGQLGVQPRGPRTPEMDEQDKHEGRQALGRGLAETQGVTRGWPRGAGFPGLWSTEAVCAGKQGATVVSLPATLIHTISNQH